MTGAIIEVRRQGQIWDIIASTRVRLGSRELAELGRFVDRVAG